MSARAVRGEGKRSSRLSWAPHRAMIPHRPQGRGGAGGVTLGAGSSRVASLLYSPISEVRYLSQDPPGLNDGRSNHRAHAPDARPQPTECPMKVVRFLAASVLVLGLV